MPGVALHAATADRYEDALAALSGGGGSACCCQYWRMSSSEYGGSTLEQRRAALRAQTAEAPAPGMVAYIDGEPVGWCGFGPRERMERLGRSASSRPRASAASRRRMRTAPASRASSCAST